MPITFGGNPTPSDVLRKGVPFTDIFYAPINNSNGASSGLTSFTVSTNGGFAASFTSAQAAANSYAAWSNSYTGGAFQSSGRIAPVRGFGISAILQTPGRDDCYTRLLIAGLSAISDISLGVMTAKGFGLETDRSLAGTNNTAFRSRLIYNDGTNTFTGNWTNNYSNDKILVWIINSGTQIVGYYIGFSVNSLPPKDWSILPPVNTTTGDNFLFSASPFAQTFQLVTAGGTASNIYGEIQQVKHTYNFFP